MSNALSTRGKILKTAAQIFYREGYKITGVDRIARSAGITKATLYHYFQNKDQLIEESLRVLSQTFKDKCQDAWQRPGLTSEGRLSVLFDALHAFFSQDDCYGCPFIKATSEFEDPHHVIRQISKNHCDFVIEELENFAKDSALQNPRQVAEQIFIAIMGAYSGWYVGGIAHAALQAKEMTRFVIEAHRPS
ncbi:MAG: TetR/AcrR family transcriptional regulator [Alphaproteobacteria bacterium]|nr:TetR/AcrR family transcriptional regulator [Alphaproteobacteria bacterium]